MTGPRKGLFHAENQCLRGRPWVARASTRLPFTLEDTQMKDLLRTTAERAARYLAGLKSRGVAPSPEALTNLKRLDELFPEHPTDPAAVIALLDEIGSPATMASAGGRLDRKSTRLNSSHSSISYAVFCLKKK